MVDADAASTSGKGDPFLVKLAVDRQVEKQIEEENYLHRVSSVFCLQDILRGILITPGIPESGSIRSRTRVHRSGRDPEGVQCSGRHTPS